MNIIVPLVMNTKRIVHLHRFNVAIKANQLIDKNQLRQTQFLAKRMTKISTVK